MKCICSFEITAIYLFIRACVVACPSGHVSKRGECVPCPQGCSVCDVNQRCIHCSEGWEAAPGGRCDLTGSLQNCGKNSGSFYNRDAKTCKKCHRTCKTCFNGKPHGCLSCSKDLNLHIDSCTEVCPKETYLEGGECKHCPHACSACDGHAHCTQCQPGYFLLQNTFNKSAECVESCGVGMYPDSR